MPSAQLLHAKPGDPHISCSPQAYHRAAKPCPGDPRNVISFHALPRQHRAPNRDTASTSPVVAPSQPIPDHPTVLTVPTASRHVAPVGGVPARDSDALGPSIELAGNPLPILRRAWMFTLPFVPICGEEAGARALRGKVGRTRRSPSLARGQSSSNQARNPLTADQTSGQSTPSQRHDYLSASYLQIPLLTFEDGRAMKPRESGESRASPGRLPPCRHLG